MSVAVPCGCLSVRGLAPAPRDETCAGEMTVTVTRASAAMGFNGTANGHRIDVAVVH